jgi:Domain of unknown function (DUF929)
MPNNAQRASAKPTSTRPPASRKFIERQEAKQRAATAARQARRYRNRMLGIGSVVLAIVIVAVFVVIKVTGSGGSPAASASVSSPPAGTPIPAAITSKLASVPLSTLVAAPNLGVLTSPQAISDPALTADGKPDLLFVGAEFCPVCATERWAMYVALSKFGTFSPEPGRIHSAVRDGDIPTLTFYKTTYTSPYFTFTPIETTTNKPDGNYYVTLQTPTPAQQKLWQAHSDGFPWLDFGGKMELTDAQYNPAELEGQTFTSIASAVGNNSTRIGADIDASAKVLIQTICSTLSGNKPAAVCSAVGHA